MSLLNVNNVLGGLNSFGINSLDVKESLDSENSPMDIFMSGSLEEIETDCKLEPPVIVDDMLRGEVNE